MKRVIAIAGVLLSTVWLAACGTSTTTSAAATFSVVPATATAVASTSGKTFTILGDSTHVDRVIAYPWQTSFTVTITETAGVGRKITGVSIKVQQASGGVIMVPTGTDLEHYDYLSQVSNNYIAAKGTGTVTFNPVWYWLPNGGREAVVTMTFSFLDDNDSSFSESTTVNVQ
jgi:hypothetical protein